MEESLDVKLVNLQNDFKPAVAIEDSSTHE